MKAEEVSYLKLMKMLGSKVLNECTIEITNSCPFKCDHCYVGKKNLKMMSFSQFKCIVDQLIKINCNIILITGGEPMANPSFNDMYIYAKKRGLIVNINTTCFLVNETILSMFKKYRPKTIEVSLYGYDNASYEQFTHKSNAFDVVFKNIKKLQEMDINLNIKTVLTQKNYLYINKLKKISKDNGLKFRYDYIVFPKIDNKFNKNEEALDVDSIISVIKQDSDDIQYFTRAVKNVKKLKEHNNDVNKVFQCTLGKDRAFIDCNYFIKPCLVVPLEYNLNDYSIEEALKLINKDVSNFNISDNNKCKNCYKRGLCRYCPGRFFLETGSYEQPPEFYCKMADALIKEFSDEI